MPPDTSPDTALAHAHMRSILHTSIIAQPAHISFLHVLLRRAQWLPWQIGALCNLLLYSTAPAVVQSPISTNHIYGTKSENKNRWRGRGKGKEETLNLPFPLPAPPFLCPRTAKTIRGWRWSIRGTFCCQNEPRSRSKFTCARFWKNNNRQTWFGWGSSRCVAQCWVSGVGKCPRGRLDQASWRLRVAVQSLNRVKDWNS